MKKTAIGRLRPKQRKAARLQAAGENGVEAVLKAGYNPKNRQNAAVIASALNKKPAYQEYRAELEQKIAARLDDDRLIKKHSELLDAEDNLGPVYKVQQTALQDAYKLKGFPGFAPTQHNHLHVGPFMEKLQEEALEDIE